MPEVEDVHGVAHRHHQGHVVLGENDGKAFRRQPLQELADGVCLGLVQARGGLVQQEQARLDDQGPGEFEQPGPAGGELVRRYVCQGCEAHHLQRLPGGRLRGPCGATGLVLDGGQDVLSDGEGAEQFEVLERPGDPQVGPQVGRQRGDVPPVEDDSAADRAGESAHDVEQRGLAASVRSDEPGDLAGRGRDADILQSRQPAEADGDAVKFQERHGGTPQAVRARPRRL